MSFEYFNTVFNFLTQEYVRLWSLAAASRLRGDHGMQFYTVWRIML
jgi:hypothetical protein